MAGLSWLMELIKLFFDLIPRPNIVTPERELVEYVFGGGEATNSFWRIFGKDWTRVHKEGWYIEWPAIAEYDPIRVKYTFYEFIQELPLPDGKTVGIRTGFGIEVADAKKFSIELDDPLTTLPYYAKMTQTEVLMGDGDVVTEDIFNKSGEVKESVARKIKLRLAKRLMRRFGARLRDLSMTSKVEMPMIGLWNTSGD